MGQTEFEIFLVLATLILFAFIGGIIVFVFQYHRRKIIYEKEKAIINEQHIQELLNTRLEIQQRTMEDIGREIHDGIGQHLVLASIYANRMAFESQYPAVQNEVETISKILNESLADLRSLSKNLTNASAEFEELRTLVENECRRIQQLNICNIECHFTDADFHISASIKVFILRIIQEFLQNSLKHSNCRNVYLDITYSAEGLRVRARDDGKGFNIENYLDNPNAGIGLRNMKKRAELIGAGFVIKSTLDKGTELNLLIPTNKLNVS